MCNLFIIREVFNSLPHRAAFNPVQQYSPARFSVNGTALMFQVAVNGDDDNYALYRSDDNGDSCYRILPDEDTEVGEVIRNAADIYFDFNAPITTNTTSTTLTLPVGIKGTGPVSSSLKLYPNPAHSWFTLETPEGVAGKSRLMIFDAGGKLIREGGVAHSKNHQVPAGGLAPGAY